MPSLQILGAEFAKSRCRIWQVPNLTSAEFAFQPVPNLTGAELSCTHIFYLCDIILISDDNLCISIEHFLVHDAE